MADQILHILKQERSRTCLIDNSSYVEEECSLRGMPEAVIVSERPVFSDSSDTEGLAREAGDEYVVLWYFERVDPCYIARRSLSEIRCIRLASKAIPLAGK